MKYFSALLLIIIGVWVLNSFNIHSNIVARIVGTESTFHAYSFRRSSLGGGIGASIFTFSPIISIPLRFAYGFISPPPVPSLSNITGNYYWMGTIPWFLCTPFLLWSIFHAFKRHSSQLLSLKIVVIFFAAFFLVAQLVVFSELHGLGGRLVGVVLIIYGIENYPRPIKNVTSYMVIIGIFFTLCYLGIKIFL
ncbi:MAG: hypothetical protein H8D45_00815 [Bacteroidetes bacterium]|nr:hypothetical protein [Bacteroidota bacterium]